MAIGENYLQVRKSILQKHEMDLQKYKTYWHNTSGLNKVKIVLAISIICYVLYT